MLLGGRKAKERGAEPDECYRVGTLMKDGEFPDIVLEVMETSPILDKLHVHGGFDVPKVWLFRNARFELYRLTNAGYEPIERSDFLPDLDFELPSVKELAHAGRSAPRSSGDRPRVFSRHAERTFWSGTAISSLIGYLVDFDEGLSEQLRGRPTALHPLRALNRTPAQNGGGTSGKEPVA